MIKGFIPVEVKTRLSVGASGGRKRLRRKYAEEKERPKEWTVCGSNE